MNSETRGLIESALAEESRRAFASLVRICGDFDLAEDALQDAVWAALTAWERDGIPENPRAWLVTTARFRAIDAIRKRNRLVPLTSQQEDGVGAEIPEPEAVDDDVLRLIFTCCHPALAPESQIALTLREVCGLTTDEIASAFLVPVATLAQRIVRAKAKIRDSAIPFVVPEKSELPARLRSVLRVIYLVFNEGYSASAGPDLVRTDLVAEAIRIAVLTHQMLPNSEVRGMLALMMFHRARQSARVNSVGEIVPLSDQDRSGWDWEMIGEANEWLRLATESGELGTYTLQAAILAVHAHARSYDETDWNTVVSAYDALIEREPSPVAELNRAVAVAQSGQTEVALRLVENLVGTGGLKDYALAHGVLGDLYQRMGRTRTAENSYQSALDRTNQASARQIFTRKIAELNLPAKNE